MATTILFLLMLMAGLVGLMIVAVSRNATRPARGRGNRYGPGDGGAIAIYGGGDSDCSPGDSGCDGGGGVGDGGGGGGGD